MTPTPVPAWLSRSQFPFQPQLVDVGENERLSVIDVGTGPVLLFSHGTPTWSYEWRHHLQVLSKTHRCIAVDHLGFGLSPRKPNADYRPEAHARRFAALIERLGIERYGLVLHDFGGPIALAAALERPERVAHIVMYNTFAWALGEVQETKLLAKLAGSRLFRWLYRYLNFSFVIARLAWGDKRTRSKATWTPYTRLFSDADSRERVLFALAKSMTGSANYFASLWQRLDRLASVPIHLIWGMKDPAFPPSALARLESALPHASKLQLPTAGHWPHEEQPEVCVASVQAFLERVQPPAA